MRTLAYFLAAAGIPFVVILGLYSWGLSQFKKIMTADFPPVPVLLLMAALVITPAVQLFLYFRYRSRDKEISAALLYALILGGMVILGLAIGIYGS